MKNFSGLALALLMTTTAPAFAANSYSCRFNRADFGHEKELDSFRLENRNDANVLKTYADLALTVACQIESDKAERQDLLTCLIGDTKNNSAGAARVLPGTSRLTVGYSQGGALYDLTCRID